MWKGVFLFLPKHHKILGWCVLPREIVSLVAAYLHRRSGNNRIQQISKTIKHLYYTVKTRWNPRTRMPTRMLKNRNNTYLSHFPANPLVGHPDVTHWGDTLVGHPSYLTLLLDTLVRHSYWTLLLDTSSGTLWLDILVRHSYLTLFWDTLTCHFCKTLLTWHSCKTLVLDTSYSTLLLDTSSGTLLLDTPVRHSYWTLLLDTSSGTLLLDILVRHSYLTLFWDTLTWHSC